MGHVCVVFRLAMGHVCVAFRLAMGRVCVACPAVLEAYIFRVYR
jgi:hypothetical protein